MKLYFYSQASLKVWESQEEAKARLQAEIIRKVAQDRQGQLEEKKRRVQNVSKTACLKNRINGSRSRKTIVIIK